jgi:chemotaxis protein histidine kinase CheA
VDQIKSQIDVLSELSDDQVAQLQADIVSEFESVESQDPTAETVDAMTSLADMLDSVKTEVQQREAAAEELAARAAEATMRVKGEGEDMGDDEMIPADEVETPEAEEEVEPDMEADEAGMTPKDEEDKKDMKSYSSDSSTASTEAVEGSELSTEEETEAEVVTEDAPVAEEVVAEATIESSVELSTEEEQPAVEAEAEKTEEEPVTEEAVVASGDDSAEVPAEDSVVDAETPQEADVVEAVVETEAVAEASTQEENPIALVEQEEQAPVTASADESFQAPADRQPVIQVLEPAKVAITAGADIPGYTAGTEINNMYEVASAMEKRIHSLRRVNGGDGEQHIVASITTQFPEERTLSTDAESNASKIDAVVGQDALVASGGHAAPFEVKYDIFGIGSTTDRPVRDALPRFQADRGGIRFVTPPNFASGAYANAVGIWTAANDSAETPSPSAKLSLTITAAQENTVSTDAVTLQLQFGNLMTRAYPELIARHNELALVQHAREAEQNLLANIATGSTAVTTTSVIGFGRDFLVQIRRAATAYRSRHRIDPQARLKAIIPAWVYDAMAADLALAMPGDGTLSVSRSEIDGYLANVNVDLVASLDATVFGSQSAAALLEFPDSFVWYLFAEGTFLFLDGGTLDLGIIRDSSLVGTNDYKMFIETFENVAKVGIESLAITSTISVNGVAAALRDTTGGATAAAVEY